jgi:hypothetical protein
MENKNVRLQKHGERGVDNFKVVTYSIGDDNEIYGAWHKGLIVMLTKNGVTIELNEKEIVEMMRSFPHPIGYKFVD